MGVKNGYGIREYIDGSYYEGDFSNNLFNGEGRYLLKDGDKYIGGFLNNLRHGKGKYTFSDGSYYIGDWYNNLRTGREAYKSVVVCNMKEVTIKIYLEEKVSIYI